MKYIQAIKDKVVVEVIPLEKVTAGGIIIPDGAGENDPHRFGKVVSLGSEVTDISIGDLIVFNKHGGMATILDGKLYKTLCLGEIFGKFVDAVE